MVKKEHFEPERLDDRLIEQGKKMRADIIKRMVDLPFASRNGEIRKLFRHLEAITQDKVQAHLARSLMLLGESRDNYKINSLDQYRQAFNAETEQLEQDLKTRLDGFGYADRLIDVYRDTRAGEWAHEEKQHHALVNQIEHELREEIKAIYQSVFHLQDLKKEVLAKALDAFNQPVPEAHLLAAFDSWDTAMDNSWDQLNHKMRNVFGKVVEEKIASVLKRAMEK